MATFAMELSFGGTIGNRHLYVWQVLGDGSTQTVPSGLACVDSVWYNSKSGASFTYENQVYKSGTDGYFAKALEDGKYYNVFFLGS